MATLLDDSAPWKVLIVDDEPDVIKTSQDALFDVVVLERGLHFLSASSAADAEALLLQHPDIAVVLLDVVMERLQSGLELVDRIRKIHLNPGVKIILRTGKSGKEPELDVVYRYAIDDYIDKGSATRHQLITAVITAIRSFEQFKRLERLSARHELLVASIGHDLRGPLQVIQSSLSLLSKSSSPVERLKRSQTALFTTKLLARLVDDILGVARGEPLSFQTQTVDLRKWFDQFISTITTRIEKRKLNLETSFSAISTHAEVDPDRLTQCVGNLVENALRYTDSGSISISVALETGASPTQAQNLRIDVRDTGVGIAQADLARIFEPFERGSSSSTLRYTPQGIGLGLSIVDNLTKGLGGTVTVESSLGKGSVFTLQIPVLLSAISAITPRQKLTAAGSKVADANTTTQADILVVDDDLDICTSVVDVLRDAGFIIDEAHDVNEALLKSENRRYKIVLTDIQMPGFNGFEFAHMLQLSDNPPFLIAMTAYMEGFMADPRSNYFQAKLAKPFENDALLSIIASSLEDHS